MAFEKRTIEEIENAMIADKESRPELNALDSTSNFSVWRNLIYSFSVAASLHEGSFQDFLNNVNQRSFEVIGGTEPWYASESLLFQFGDDLINIGDVLGYEVIDEEKRIIKLAAADNEGGVLIIKVAQLDANNNPFPLDSNQLNAFREYWRRKKFAGTAIDFRSQLGDQGIFNIRIGVDASVIKRDNGESILNPGLFPVQDAIKNFLVTYQLTNFSGLFRIVDLVDAIQAVNGVFNVVVDSIQVKPFDGEFVNVTDSENEEYVAKSGYIIIDPDNLLENTLNYY